MSQHSDVFDWLQAVRDSARTQNCCEGIDVRLGIHPGKPSQLHFFEGHVSYDAYHCEVCVAETIAQDASDHNLHALATAILEDLHGERVAYERYRQWETYTADYIKRVQG
jgi:hypothetical protein